MCPFCAELMRDLVVAADGYTYEREINDEWLSKNDTSPKTNQELSNKTLVPNIAIKALIADCAKKQKYEAASASSQLFSGEGSTHVRCTDDSNQQMSCLILSTSTID